MQQCGAGAGPAASHAAAPARLCSPIREVAVRTQPFVKWHEYFSSSLKLESTTNNMHIVKLGDEALVSAQSWE